jgi:hypothetical protein
VGTGGERKVRRNIFIAPACHGELVEPWHAGPLRQMAPVTPPKGSHVARSLS